MGRAAGIDHEAGIVHLAGKDAAPVAWEPRRLAARSGGVEVYRRDLMELRAGDRKSVPRTEPAPTGTLVRFRSSRPVICSPRSTRLTATTRGASSTPGPATNGTCARISTASCSWNRATRARGRSARRVEHRGTMFQNLYSVTHIRLGRADELRRGAFLVAVLLLITWGTGPTNAWATDRYGQVTDI